MGARHFLDLSDAGGDALAAMLNDAIDRKRHSEDDVYLKEASTFDVRVLLTRFLELQQWAQEANPDSDTARGDENKALIAVSDQATALDEAWLLDTDKVHPSQEQLLRFDSLPDRPNADGVIEIDDIFTDRTRVLDWSNRRVDDHGVPLTTTRHDLQPRCGQLVYSMYLHHCFGCTESLGVCQFPGCRRIRQEAAALVQLSLLESSPDGDEGVPYTQDNIEASNILTDNLFHTTHEKFQMDCRLYVLQVLQMRYGQVDKTLLQNR